MTPYTIASIPTVYRGRQYRSRLEAKWAAFFDLLGWTYEYEPFDLGSWSPDFLIKPVRVGWACSLLVEVKPLTSISDAVCRKMEKAASARTRERLLLLGTGPQAVSECDRDIPKLQLGWVGVDHGDGSGHHWDTASLLWFSDWDRPSMHADILVEDRVSASGLRGALSGEAYYPTSADIELARYPEHAAALWAEATNAVQWRGEQAQP